MAFRSNQVVLGTPHTPALVHTAVAGDLDAWLLETSSTLAVYISGTSSVTVGNGFGLPNQSALHLQVRPGDEIWAVSGSVNARVELLVRSA